MKKLATTLAVALTLGASLAGCGSPNEETNKPAPAESKDPAASADNGSNEKITITGMKFKYGDLPKINGSNGINMINERFNVDYQLNLIPQGTYSEKVSATFASGTLPDYLTLEGDDVTSRYPKFAAQGAFVDLTPYIEQYPTLKSIPEYVLDQFKIDGKIYAIPAYAPKAGFTVMIRKDWLDNLGLSVPATHEELKQAALAFTKNDPDKNGKADTYGFALGQDINPKIPLGTYWDPYAWYHKDEQGRFIPGSIGPGFKDVIQMLADLYKEGAVTRDFVTLDWANTNKEFYSGKAGIFIAAANGMSQAYMEGLLEIQPEAQFVALEAFQAPDGSQGWTAGRGYGSFNVISAQIADEPAKLQRLLEMIDFSRQFYPPQDRNENNEGYDWMTGKLGVGYEIVDGKPKFMENAVIEGRNPGQFMPDGGWPAKDSDNNYPSAYTLPILKEVAGNMVEHQSGANWYANPNYTANSPAIVAQGAELDKFLIDEQTKMIAGQRPVSDWDKMVEEWKAKGGEQVIAEVNAGITIKDASEAWFKE